MPDEEEQFRAYRDLVLGMTGRRSRYAPWTSAPTRPTVPAWRCATNPIRRSAARRAPLAVAPALFETQMRAIVRASGYGPMRVLVPMVSDARRDPRRAPACSSVCGRRCASEGHEIADHIPLGAMIEVPAAAIALPGFIDSVDFLSIGTNDLIQYLLAADRNNEALGELYSPLHPARAALLAR